MKNWQLRSQRKNNNKRLLLGIFAVVIFSQLISTHHQIQHITDYNEIVCIQCINTPDQVDSLPALSFTITLLETSPNLTIIVFNQVTTPLKSYSARAPPSIV
jgi:hypothetical protein